MLNSWKEIAVYLKCGVRTVQRYERESQLPVRRMSGKARGAVIAFPAELDVWLRQSFPGKESPGRASDLRVSHALRIHQQRMSALNTNLLRMMEQLCRGRQIRALATNSVNQ